MVKIPEEDVGLSPDNAELVNARFYAGKPWGYFRRRLVHLAMTADPDAQLVTGQTEFKVGDVSLRIDPHEGDTGREPDLSPIANTQFVAAEGEVLLHHVSETVLRLALAHAPESDGERPDAPGLKVARARSFAAVKQAIREQFIKHPDADYRRRRAKILFGSSPSDDEGTTNERLDELDGWLVYFAEIFLDSDAYNAAKHGFALRGERSAIDLRLEDTSVMEAAGYSLAYLHAPKGAHGRRRWQITTRWYSLEVTLALISTASDLIEALWTTARHRYRGAPRPPLYRPGSLPHLLARDDGDPRRLVEMYTALHYSDTVDP
jgi:hypothetical protein